jgi:glycosyltransferase involved in cell wall biosynthesis
MTELSADMTITVLMPAWNAAAYIGAAIQSVLDQTYSAFELLVVNDGSTDDTENIVRSFTDPRIVLVSTEHRGVSHALNTGLKLARGKYIARFDADDLCLPDRLEKQWLFLENNPGYVITGSDAGYLLDNGQHLFDFTCIAHDDQMIREKMYRVCPFIHSAVMYRKDIVLEAGGYSPYAHHFEDHLLWIQLSTFGKMHNLPEKLVQIRFSAGSVTIDDRWRSKRFRILKEKILQKGMITAEEGDLLQRLLEKENSASVKQGAYHALCGKKLLANNYQPRVARQHILKAISYKPFRADSYLLYLVSFLPAPFIGRLHRLLNPNMNG